MNMKKIFFTSLGFVVSPLFTVIALVFIDQIGLLGRDRVYDIEFVDIIGAIFILYCYAFLITLISGLPAYLIFRYFKKVTWWTSVFFGVCLGGAMFFLGMSLLLAPLGGVSGFIFWFIESKGVSFSEKYK